MGVVVLVGLGLLSKMILVLRGMKVEKLKEGDVKIVEVVLGEDVVRNGVVKGDDEFFYFGNYEFGIEMKVVDFKVLEVVLSSFLVLNVVILLNFEKVIGDEVKF